MLDNVKVTYTEDGALTTIDLHGYRYAKRYPTMRAAAAEARSLELISASQQTFLSGPRYEANDGLGNYADEVDSNELKDSGFGRTSIVE